MKFSRKIRYGVRPPAHKRNGVGASVSIDLDDLLNAGKEKGVKALLRDAREVGLRAAEEGRKRW